MGQKNGIHALGYNSTESESIWMKFGTLDRDGCYYRPQTGSDRTIMACRLYGNFDEVRLR